jgi:hypothetical protein
MKKETRAEYQAQRERAVAAAARLQALAEKAQADLDRRRGVERRPEEDETPRERALAHAAHLQALAEKAQAELDGRRQHGSQS